MVVFGSIKAAGMARDLGPLVGGANRTVEELKGELLHHEVIEEAHRSVEGAGRAHAAADDDGPGRNEGPARLRGREPARSDLPPVPQVERPC